MMPLRQIVSLTLSLVCFAAPIARAGDRPSANVPSDSLLVEQAKEIASRLQGVMDTSLQATTSPKAPNVRMSTCRIQLVETTASESTAGAIFLYQEQALSIRLNQPYRQRFLQIAPHPYSHSVRSLSFKPANLSRWISLCNKPERERTVQIGELGHPVCSVFLKQSGEEFVGNTPVDGCPANVRGAVRITNHIVLSKTGMETWDRGFDAAGKQVWGAKAESYQYRKVSGL